MSETLVIQETATAQGMARDRNLSSLEKSPGCCARWLACHVGQVGARFDAGSSGSTAAVVARQRLDAASAADWPSASATWPLPLRAYTLGSSASHVRVEALEQQPTGGCRPPVQDSSCRRSLCREVSVPAFGERDPEARPQLQ